MYYIYVKNLPEGITWQKIKDLVRHADGENVDVDRVEVYGDSRCGQIQIKDEINFRRAYDLLLSKSEWKGHRLTIQADVYPNSEPQPYHTNTQNLQVYPNNLLYLSAPVSGYAQVSIPYLPNNQYLGEAPQNTVALYNSVTAPQAFNACVVSTSTHCSNQSLSSFNPGAISNLRDLSSQEPRPPFLAQSRGVHISRLNYGTTEAEIRHLVARTLDIDDKKMLQVIIPTSASGKKKYAVVTFETNEIAQTACRALDGLIFQKYRLKVKIDKDYKTIYAQSLTTDCSLTRDLERLHLQYSMHPSDRVEMLNSPAHLASPGSMETSRQKGKWLLDCSPTIDAYEDDHPKTCTEQIIHRPSSPDLTTPPVVDGSKDRHSQHSPIQEKQIWSSQSSRELANKFTDGTKRGDPKSKKNRGGGLKGKQKHERH